jgi:hypothetical protein
MLKPSLLCALACCAFLGSCNELNPPKPRQRMIVWKPMGSWSGHGSTQTDSFDINIFRWRVRWKTTNDTAPGKSHFVLTVNSAISGRPLAELVRHDGPGEGLADVNDDPRLYHMVIESNDLDWTVTVEEPIATGGSQ